MAEKVIYYQCDKCGQVEPESRWIRGPNGSSSCLHCGSHSSDRKWPSAEVSEFIAFIRNYDTSVREYGQVASVFLSSVLELMFEQLLATMAYMDLTYDDAGLLVDALLEGYQGRSRMFALYKRIGYSNFHSAVRELGYGDFIKHWEEIVLARNGIVHGDLRKGDKVTPDLINKTIDEALAVFSQLHNLYNTESLEYKAWTERKRRLAEELSKLRKWTKSVDDASEFE